MEKLPKLNDFQPPEGYFDTLADEILKKNSRSFALPKHWFSYAAAAVLLISMGLWWTLPDENEIDTNELQALDEEALLYIESNQWTSEDVLSFSENPNLILDQIIEEEMPELTPSWSEENNWF